MPSLEQYGDARRAVARIQGRLDEQLWDVRNDKRLTDHGRRAEMAKAVVNARQKIGKLRAEHVAAREKRRDDLTRYLFGVDSSDPGEMMLLRDAQDRASKIETAADATTALRKAQLAGDKTMAKAICHNGVTNGWTDVVDTYCSGIPIEQLTPIYLSLQSLAEIPDGPQTKLADATIFRTRGPNELASYGENELERLAQDAAPDPPQQIMPHTTSWSGQETAQHAMPWSGAHQ